MGVIHPDITKAETLPSEYYTNQKNYFDLVEKFSTTWNFIGLESMLDKNNIIPVRIGNIPMLLTKSGTEYYCISNVCTHRGMLLCDESKKSSSIKCPYHGRTFSLSGEVKHMPEFENVENFPSPNDDLPVAKVINWHGLLFASLSTDDDFEQYIKAINERMSFFDFSKLVRDNQLDLSLIHI